MFAARAKVEEQEPEAGHSTAETGYSLQQRRTFAIAADERARTSVELASIWRKLGVGRVTVLDAFCSAERCFAVLRSVPATMPKPLGLTPENVEILRRALLGEMQKAIALDLEISQSSVATRAAQCLRAMGLACTARRAPLLLAMAAHADWRRDPLRLARVVVVPWQGEVVEVVSAHRPDLTAVDALSNAEREIVGLMVERRTNAEIATIRDTSVRTVANQLSSALHKLRAAGRAHLVSYLIESTTTSSRA